MKKKVLVFNTMVKGLAYLGLEDLDKKKTTTYVAGNKRKEREARSQARK